MSPTLLKQKLHTLIDATDNEVLLEDMYIQAQSRLQSNKPHEIEGLSEEDYAELLSLVNEPLEEDTLSYSELKSSLSKWFVPSPK